MAAADEKEIRVKAAGAAAKMVAVKEDDETTENEQDVSASKESKRKSKEPKKQLQSERRLRPEKEFGKQQEQIGQHSKQVVQQKVASPTGKTATVIPIQPYGYAAYPYYPAMPPAYAPPNSNVMTGANNPHTYTDVSGMGDPAPDTRRNRGGVTEPFPEKLHRMLESVEREGATDIVSFFSHGRAFAIHKPRMFVEKVMPRFFRQTRLTSFQRQLNLYGFRRISQGPDNGGYYHELFLKGRPGLCVNMKRMKVKGTAKLKRDPETEPNFYSYPPLPEKGSTGTNPAAAASSLQIHTSPPSASSPAQQASYASYPFPPPQYGYPLQTAPYTAAQQPVGTGAATAPVYGYSPYYGYPWYTHPPHTSHFGSPQATTPQTTPIKRAGDPKTPGTSPPKGTSVAGTPASTDSAKKSKSS